MCGSRYVCNTHTHANTVQGRTFSELGLCPTMSCPGPTLSLGLMGRDHCHLRMCLLAVLSRLSLLAGSSRSAKGRAHPLWLLAGLPWSTLVSTDLTVLEHPGLVGLDSETPGCDSGRATYPSKHFLRESPSGLALFPGTTLVSEELLSFGEGAELAKCSVF